MLFTDIQLITSTYYILYFLLFKISVFTRNQFSIEEQVHGGSGCPQYKTCTIFCTVNRAFMENSLPHTFLANLPCSSASPCGLRENACIPLFELPLKLDTLVPACRGVAERRKHPSSELRLNVTERALLAIPTLAGMKRPGNSSYSTPTTSAQRAQRHGGKKGKS